MEHHAYFLCFENIEEQHMLNEWLPSFIVIWTTQSISFDLQVGLLYDEVSLQNVLDMTSDWTSEERQMLRTEVHNGAWNSMVIFLSKHVCVLLIAL